MRLRNTKHYRKRTVTEMHCEISYKSEFLRNNFYQFPDFQLMTTNVAPPTINELLNQDHGRSSSNHVTELSCS